MRIEEQIARDMRARIDGMLMGALVGSIAPTPARPSVLTMDMLGEAYDLLWDIPPEPYWFLCHPDDLAWVRALVGRESPGKHTCPIVRARKECPPGQVMRFTIDHDEAWMWPWQRRKGG